MPKYPLTLPNGQSFDIDSPNELSQSQLAEAQGQLMAQFGQAQPDPTPVAEPSLSNNAFDPIGAVRDAIGQELPPPEFGAMDVPGAAVRSTMGQLGQGMFKIGLGAMGLTTGPLVDVLTGNTPFQQNPSWETLGETLNPAKSYARFKRGAMAQNINDLARSSVPVWERQNDPSIAQPTGFTKSAIDFTGGVASSVIMSLPAMVTGIPGLIGMSMATFDPAFEEAQSKGAGDTKAFAHAVLSTAFEAGSEYVGSAWAKTARMMETMPYLPPTVRKYLFQAERGPVEDAAKEAARSFWGTLVGTASRKDGIHLGTATMEGLEEVFSTVAQRMSAAMLYDPTQITNIGDLMMDAGMSFLGGAAAGVAFTPLERRVARQKVGEAMRSGVFEQYRTALEAAKKDGAYRPEDQKVVNEAVTGRRLMELGALWGNTDMVAKGKEQLAAATTPEMAAATEAEVKKAAEMFHAVQTPEGAATAHKLAVDQFGADSPQAKKMAELVNQANEHRLDIARAQAVQTSGPGMKSEEWAKVVTQEGLSPDRVELHASQGFRDNETGLPTENPKDSQGRPNQEQEGYVDPQTGKIHIYQGSILGDINAGRGSRRVRQREHFRQVLREEAAHTALQTPLGRSRLNAYVEHLKANDSKAYQAIVDTLARQGYHPDIIPEEYVAKLYRQQSWFQQKVDDFMLALHRWTGIGKLNHVRAGRLLIRSLVEHSRQGNLRGNAGAFQPANAAADVRQQESRLDMARIRALNTEEAKVIASGHAAILTQPQLEQAIRDLTTRLELMNRQGIGGMVKLETERVLKAAKDEFVARENVRRQAILNQATAPVQPPTPNTPQGGTAPFVPVIDQQPPTPPPNAPDQQQQQTGSQPEHPNGNEGGQAPEAGNSNSPGSPAESGAEAPNPEESKVASYVPPENPGHIAADLSTKVQQGDLTRDEGTALSIKFGVQGEFDQFMALIDKVAAREASGEAQAEREARKAKIDNIVSRLLVGDEVDGGILESIEPRAEDDHWFVVRHPGGTTSASNVPPIIGKMFDPAWVQSIESRKLTREKVLKAEELKKKIKGKEKPQDAREQAAAEARAKKEAFERAEAERKAKEKADQDAARNEFESAFQQAKALAPGDKVGKRVVQSNNTETTDIQFEGENTPEDYENVAVFIMDGNDVVKASTPPPAAGKTFKVGDRVQWMDGKITRTGVVREQTAIGVSVNDDDSGRNYLLASSDLTELSKPVSDQPQAPAIIEAWKKGKRELAQQLADRLPEPGDTWAFRTSDTGNLAGYGAGDSTFTRDLTVRGKPLWQWINEAQADTLPKPGSNAQENKPAAGITADNLHKQNLRMFTGILKPIIERVRGIFDRLERGKKVSQDDHSFLSRYRAFATEKVRSLNEGFGDVPAESIAQKYTDDFEGIALARDYTKAQLEVEKRHLTKFGQLFPTGSETGNIISGLLGRVMEAINRHDGVPIPRLASKIPKRPIRKPSTRERAPDLIDLLIDTVGKIDPKLIKEANPDFKPTGAARLLFSPKGTPADQAMHAVVGQMGVTADMSIDQFAEAITAAANGRKATRKGWAAEGAQNDADAKRALAFHAFLDKERPSGLSVSELKMGDSFTVDGDPFSVIGVEYGEDGGPFSVTLDGGKKWGTQVVDGKKPVTVDDGSFAGVNGPIEPETSKLPSEIADEIRRVVGFIQEVRNYLNSQLQWKDNHSRFVVEEYLKDNAQAIEAAQKTIQEFRDVAPTHNIDAELVIEELGGVPDITLPPEKPAGIPGFFDAIESDEDRIARERNEAEQRRAKADADKLRDLANKPLKGTAGDLGQGALFAEPGDQDLFAPPPADVQPKRKAMDAIQAKVDAQDATKRAKIEELKKRLKPNMGGEDITPFSLKELSPQTKNDLIELSGLYLSSDIVSFAEFSTKLIDDFGDSVRPWLQFAYESSRFSPGATYKGSMDPADWVEQLAKKYDSGATPDLESDRFRTTGQPGPDRGPTVQPENLGPAQPGDRPVAPGDSQADTGTPGGVSDRGDSTTDARPAGGERLPEPAASPVVERPASHPGTQRPGRSGGTGRARVSAAAQSDLGSPEAPVVAPDVATPPPDFGAYPSDNPVADQADANARSYPWLSADPGNIESTLPMLFPSQRKNVFLAERRFAETPVAATHASGTGLGDPKRGILFTDGTGTGKTYSGAGIVKRFLMQGKTRILIAVPNANIIEAWKSAMKDLEIPHFVLPDTSTAAKGVTLTTQANLRNNAELAKQDFDLVVIDESHNLLSNEAGEANAGLRSFRMVANHPDSVERKATNAIIGPAPVQADYAGGGDFAAALHQWDQKRIDNMAKISAEVKRINELNTKALFLSATPFAYHTSLIMGDGFLYSLPDDSQRTGYNQPKGFDRFLAENLGWRMRTGKLNKPSANVDTSVMEIQLHDLFAKRGAMHGVSLDVPQDYSREFVLVRPAAAQKLDDGFSFFRGGESYQQQYPILNKVFNELWDYNHVAQLLEALKMDSAIERIRQHVAMGRKVILLHSYLKAKIHAHPFRFETYPPEFLMAFNGADLKAEMDRFRNDHAEWANIVMPDSELSLEKIRREFGDSVVFNNGKEAPRSRVEAVIDFNRDGGGVNLLVGQLQATKEGVSLHDKSGKHQRVMMMVALPIRPTDAIQAEGRGYRIGVKTDAINEYIVLHTMMERFAFASKINERADTVETLALGSDSRNLRDRFRDGYLNAIDADPNDQQGKGSKEADRRAETMSDFDRAVSFYFARTKKNSRTKSAEGLDYYPTPEPLGLKMVEWADPSAGDALLEPSAGHGAIGQWFPNIGQHAYLEPSAELRSELGIKVKAGTVYSTTFEDYHITNKFDEIVMNPPFGRAGATAFAHLAKAFRHLVMGGRIVALVPDGANTNDKIVELLRAGNDPTGHYDGRVLRADISLPSSVFERAGTSVRTRLLIFDTPTYSDLHSGHRIGEGLENLFPPTFTTKIEANTIQELFDQIRDLDVPARIRKPKPAPSNPLTTRDAIIQTTSQGPGVVPTRQQSTTPQLPPLFKLGQTTHAKKGIQLFVATLTKSLSDANFSVVNRIAKKHDGYYSGYNKANAIPGFQFDAADQRDDFVAEVERALRPPDESTPTYSLKARDPFEVNDITRTRGAIMASIGVPHVADAMTMTPDEFAAGKHPTVLGFSGKSLWQAINSGDPTLSALLRSPAYSLKVRPVQSDLFDRETTRSIAQAYTSAGTSLPNNRPALFSVIDNGDGWKAQSRNIDFGAGKSLWMDDALKSRGVENLRYDPFNEASAVNEATVDSALRAPADTLTVANVLNVVAPEAALDETIRQTARLLKPDGKAYFWVHFENGKKSGVPRGRPDSWQWHHKAEWYVPHLSRFYGKVETIGQNMIVASQPIPVVGEWSPSAEGPTFSLKPRAYDLTPNGGNPMVPRIGYLTGKHSAKILARAQARGDIGALITPTSSHSLDTARSYPFYAVDNGVFGKAGFNEPKFNALLNKIQPGDPKVLFVVAPDVLAHLPNGQVVGDAAATIERFKDWGPRIRERGLPVAFVAQDGLEDRFNDIPWDGMDVLFIGGSTGWKLGEFADPERRRRWEYVMGEAHNRGIPIHMGRVNSNERLTGHAVDMAASTADGTLLAFGEDINLPRLESWLDQLNHGGLSYAARNMTELGRLPTRREIIDLASDRNLAYETLGAFEPALDEINATRNELGLPPIAPRQFDPGQAEFGFSLKKPVRMFRSYAELETGALQFESWRDWYSADKANIDSMFGKDAPLFAQVLAATSIQTEVPDNVGRALRAYIEMIQGAPFTGQIPSARVNLERIRDGESIRGPKIEPFARAIMGDESAIAVDRHVIRAIFGEDAVATPALIRKAQDVIRKIAAKHGWTPRQTQAAVWAWKINLNGKTPQRYLDSLTPDRFASTIRGSGVEGLVRSRTNFGQGTQAGVGTGAADTGSGVQTGNETPAYSLKTPPDHRPLAEDINAFRTEFPTAPPIVVNQDDAARGARFENGEIVVAETMMPSSRTGRRAELLAALSDAGRLNIPQGFWDRSWKGLVAASPVLIEETRKSIGGNIDTQEGRNAILAELVKRTSKSSAPVGFVRSALAFFRGLDQTKTPAYIIAAMQRTLDRVTDQFTPHQAGPQGEADFGPTDTLHQYIGGLNRDGSQRASGVQEQVFADQHFALWNSFEPELSRMEARLSDLQTGLLEDHQFESVRQRMQQIADTVLATNIANHRRAALNIAADDFIDQVQEVNPDLLTREDIENHSIYLNEVKARRAMSLMQNIERNKATRDYLTDNLPQYPIQTLNRRISRQQIRLSDIEQNHPEMYARASELKSRVEGDPAARAAADAISDPAIQEWVEVIHQIRESGTQPRALAAMPVAIQNSAAVAAGVFQYKARAMRRELGDRLVRTTDTALRALNKLVEERRNSRQKEGQIEVAMVEMIQAARGDAGASGGLYTLEEAKRMRDIGDRAIARFARFLGASDPGTLPAELRDAFIEDNLMSIGIDPATLSGPNSFDLDRIATDAGISREAFLQIMELARTSRPFQNMVVALADEADERAETSILNAIQRLQRVRNEVLSRPRDPVDTTGLTPKEARIAIARSERAIIRQANQEALLSAAPFLRSLKQQTLELKQSNRSMDTQIERLERELQTIQNLSDMANAVDGAAHELAPDNFGVAEMVYQTSDGVFMAEFLTAEGTQPGVRVSPGEEYSAEKIMEIILYRDAALRAIAANVNPPEITRGLEVAVDMVLPLIDANSTPGSIGKTLSPNGLSEQWTKYPMGVRAAMPRLIPGISGRRLAESMATYARVGSKVTAILNKYHARRVQLLKAAMDSMNLSPTDELARSSFRQVYSEVAHRLREHGSNVAPGDQTFSGNHGSIVTPELITLLRYDREIFRAVQDIVESLPYGGIRESIPGMDVRLIRPSAETGDVGLARSVNKDFEVPLARAYSAAVTLATNQQKVTGQNVIPDITAFWDMNPHHILFHILDAGRNDLAFARNPQLVALEKRYAADIRAGRAQAPRTVQQVVNALTALAGGRIPPATVAKLFNEELNRYGKVALTRNSLESEAPKRSEGVHIGEDDTNEFSSPAAKLIYPSDFYEYGANGIDIRQAVERMADRAQVAMLAAMEDAAKTLNSIVSRLQGPIQGITSEDHDIVRWSTPNMDKSTLFKRVAAAIEVLNDRARMLRAEKAKLIDTGVSPGTLVQLMRANFPMILSWPRAMLTNVVGGPIASVYTMAAVYGRPAAVLFAALNSIGSMATLASESFLWTAKKLGFDVTGGSSPNSFLSNRAEALDWLESVGLGVTSYSHAEIQELQSYMQGPGLKKAFFRGALKVGAAVENVLGQHVGVSAGDRILNRFAAQIVVPMTLWRLKKLALRWQQRLAKMDVVAGPTSLRDTRGNFMAEYAFSDADSQNAARIREQIEEAGMNPEDFLAKLANGEIDIRRFWRTEAGAKFGQMILGEFNASNRINRPHPNALLSLLGWTSFTLSRSLDLMRAKPNIGRFKRLGEAAIGAMAFSTASVLSAMLQQAARQGFNELQTTIARTIADALRVPPDKDDEWSVFHWMRNILARAFASFEVNASPKANPWEKSWWQRPWTEIALEVARDIPAGVGIDRLAEGGSLKTPFSGMMVQSMETVGLAVKAIFEALGGDTPQAKTNALLSAKNALGMFGELGRAMGNMLMPNRRQSVHDIRKAAIDAGVKFTPPDTSFGFQFMQNTPTRGPLLDAALQVSQARSEADRLAASDRLKEVSREIYQAAFDKVVERGGFANEHDARKAADEAGRKAVQSALSAMEPVTRALGRSVTPTEFAALKATGVLDSTAVQEESAAVAVAARILSNTKTPDGGHSLATNTKAVSSPISGAYLGTGGTVSGGSPVASGGGSAFGGGAMGAGASVLGGSSSALRGGLGKLGRSKFGLRPKKMRLGKPGKSKVVRLGKLKVTRIKVPKLKKVAVKG